MKVKVNLSPDPVWHPVGLVAVTVAVAGVLRPAGGSLVPPQSHGPVGEDRNALGDTPGEAGREPEETLLRLWSTQGDNGTASGLKLPDATVPINL